MADKLDPFLSPNPNMLGMGNVANLLGAGGMNLN